MARPVLIMGKSGSGKSASLRNFAPDQEDIINVRGKELPFRNKFENIFVTDNYPMVLKAVEKSKKKAVVIDDAGYLITNEFMKGHSAKAAGNSVFALYNDMADHFWTLINEIKNLEDDKKVVYLIMHEDKNDNGDVKPKTIGRLLDEKVCVEGLFTIVLRAEKDGDKYVFRTKTTGADVTKTPIGMFEQETIDNDLAAVDAAIREYYEL